MNPFWTPPPTPSRQHPQLATLRRAGQGCSAMPRSPDPPYSRSSLNPRQPVRSHSVLLHLPSSSPPARVPLLRGERRVLRATGRGCTVSLTELELPSKFIQQGFNDRCWIWARKVGLRRLLLWRALSTPPGAKAAGVQGFGSFPGDGIPGAAHLVHLHSRTPMRDGTAPAN